MNLVKSFHDCMEASVNFCDVISEALNVENGVKQDNLVTPTLFAIFFSILPIDTFHVRYRSTGELFNIRRFEAKTKILLTLVCDLLYADDDDLVSHTTTDMQHFMDRLSQSCKSFDLNKTVVMFQPTSVMPYLEPPINVDGKNLKVDEKLTYLPSI